MVHIQACGEDVRDRVEENPLQRHHGPMRRLRRQGRIQGETQLQQDPTKIDFIFFWLIRFGSRMKV